MIVRLASPLIGPLSVKVLDEVLSLPRTYVSAIVTSPARATGPLTLADVSAGIEQCPYLVASRSANREHLVSDVLPVEIQRRPGVDGGHVPNQAQCTGVPQLHRAVCDLHSAAKTIGRIEQ